MGMRGPAPKPTVVKVLRGNPGKRALPKGEPRPATGDRVPSAPRWLSEEARAEWRRLAPRLHAVGLLTEVDGLALAMLCEAFAQYMAAKTVVDGEGLLLVSEKGNSYQHPAAGLMTQARGELMKWAREFGMTPSARTRIVVDTESAEPSLADLLFEAVR
jgi:P27 family predicted phage terminase small subunit